MTPRHIICQLAAMLAMLAAGPARAADTVFSWKEDGRTVSALIDPDTRATLDNRSVRQLPLLTQSQSVRLYRTDSVQRRELATRQPGLLPVLRRGSHSQWLVPAGGVIVHTDNETALHDWVKQQGLQLQTTAVQGYWLIPTAAGEAALTLATRLQSLPGVQTASPNWAGPRAKR